MKRYLLAAVNAKYIHSNLAVYCLRAYAASKGQTAEIAEYTINQPKGEVLRDLYGRYADVAAFSCYIWNIEFIKGLVRDYKTVSPQTEVWLGGPEVSYRAKQQLAELPEVTGIMAGEGEETFHRLLSCYDKGGCFAEIPGIVFRGKDGKIIQNPPAPPLDFARLPFPYGNGSESVDIGEGNRPAGYGNRSKTADTGGRYKPADIGDGSKPADTGGRTFFAGLENRIIYYESSRGCPFSCSYCLSSLERKVRFRDIGLVEKELAFFLKCRVPQVKFIDRTFNCDAARTLRIWRFLRDHDNQETNFHFEIAAELLTEEQIDLLHSLRPGLIQLEIGVQSANRETLAAVRRKAVPELVKEKVAAVRCVDNVHVHLDLIAGLPKEDIVSFAHSFNEVYAMRPHQLQLGFLKVLSGSPLEAEADCYGIRYEAAPPYEVLLTNWLSYGDIVRLKGIEELVELYYNSGQFRCSLCYLQHFTETPFELFDRFAGFYKEKGYQGISHARYRKYEILLEFAREALWKQQDSAEMILNDMAQGNTASDDKAQDNMMSDDKTQDNMASDDKAQGNMVQNNIVRDDIVQNDMLKEDMAASAGKQGSLNVENKCHLAAAGAPKLWILQELLLYDMCLREKLKTRPSYAADKRLDREELRACRLAFLEREGQEHLEEGMYHVERFPFLPEETARAGMPVGSTCTVLFLYGQREKMYGQARVWIM